jgi:ArsR family transcriptional regulator
MVVKIERILKALADRSRLRIVNMLAEKSLCVCELTETLKLSQSTVSGHLKILKDAGLLEDEKDGLWVEYRLCRDYRFHSLLLDMLIEELEADRTMAEERKKAAQSDRNVICKK